MDPYLDRRLLWIRHADDADSGVLPREEMAARMAIGRREFDPTPE